jgi:hypothetical protein
VDSRVPAVTLDTQVEKLKNISLLITQGGEEPDNKNFQVRARGATTFRRTLVEAMRIRLMPNFRI